MAECGGGVAVEVTARKVIFEGGQMPYLQLDEHRLAFSESHFYLRTPYTERGVLVENGLIDCN